MMATVDEEKSWENGQKEERVWRGQFAWNETYSLVMRRVIHVEWEVATVCTASSVKRNVAAGENILGCDVERSEVPAKTTLVINEDRDKGN